MNRIYKIVAVIGMIAAAGGSACAQGSVADSNAIAFLTKQTTISVPVIKWEEDILEAMEPLGFVKISAFTENDVIAPLYGVKVMPPVGYEYLGEKIYYRVTLKDSYEEIRIVVEGGDVKIHVLPTKSIIVSTVECGMYELDLGGQHIPVMVPNSYGFRIMEP